MSRRTKLWLGVLALPVVLVAAGIIALKIIFTGERLKSMVVPRIEAATGRTVVVREISLSVFPSIALQMEGVVIGNRQGEGFSSTPLLTLDALRLNVNLLPLLTSRVEITSLDVDRPQLLLEVNSRNETNYADLTAQSATPHEAGPSATHVPVAETKPEPSSSVAGFLVSQLRVTRAGIDYLDHAGNSATRVRDLSFAMNVSPEANALMITGTASTDSLSYGTIATPLFAGLRLRLDHRLSYDHATDSLTIEKGEMTLQKMRLVLSGGVAGVRRSSTLNLTVGSDSLNIADLLSLIPKEYMARAGGVQGNGFARVHIAVTGMLTDTTTAELAGTVTARGASIRYAQLPKPITDITILSSFVRTKTRQEFRIGNLTASLDGSPLRMAMTVTNFDDPSLTLAASGALNLARLPEYYPLEQGTELGGEVKADVAIAGRVADPKSLRASGSVTFLDVSAKTRTREKAVRKLNGTFTFTNDIAETPRLSLLIGESDVTVAARVRNYIAVIAPERKSPRPTATVTLRSNHLRTADITGDQPGAGTVAQEAAAAAQAPGKAGSPGPGQAAGGTIGGKSAKAAFPLPDIDMAVNATIGTLTLEKFEFTNVRGTMNIAKGVITMQNLTLNAFGGTVTSTGTLNLTRPDRPLFDLALNLSALEANALLPRFTSFGQRLSGALTMTTTLKGALNDTLGLIPDALDGDGKVGLQNGSLKGFKVNQSLASQLNLPDLETLQFKDWANAFAVKSGRLVVKDLTITALNAQYVVNGSQGLDGTLDYRMSLFLPESTAPKLRISGFAGEAVNLFKEPGGRLKLDFNVGGTMDEPKLQLDTDAVRKRGEDLAKQKLDEEKKKLEESLKEKAGDALRKLFKRDKK